MVSSGLATAMGSLQVGQLGIGLHEDHEMLLDADRLVKPTPHSGDAFVRIVGVSFTGMGAHSLKFAIGANLCLCLAATVCSRRSARVAGYSLSFSRFPPRAATAERRAAQSASSSTAAGHAPSFGSEAQ